MPKRSIHDAWLRYKLHGDMKARDELIIFYAPLVKYVAGKISSTLPKSVELSDLISWGMIGLIDAVGKFDMNRETKFEAYAIPRIKGAIYDGLRAQDWAPRSLRAKARELENTLARLERKLGRPPSDDEVAEELGMSTGDLENLLADIGSSYISSLDSTIILKSSDEACVSDFIRDDESLEPWRFLEESEAISLLKKAIERLSEKEKAVIFFYYYDGLTLREIGEILGITESRVSQIRSRAILRLRGLLRELTSAGT